MFRMEGVESGKFTAICGDKPPALTVGAGVMRIDPHDFRPSVVELLREDLGKAKQKFGWEPEVTAREMCAKMVAEHPSMARPASPTGVLGPDEPRMNKPNDNGGRGTGGETRG